MSFCEVLNIDTYVVWVYSGARTFRGLRSCCVSCNTGGCGDEGPLPFVFSFSAFPTCFARHATVPCELEPST